MTSIRPAVLARLSAVGTVTAAVAAWASDHPGNDLEDMLEAILESYEAAGARPDHENADDTTIVRFFLAHFGTALSA